MNQERSADLPREGRETEPAIRAMVESLVLLLLFDAAEALLFGDGYYTSLAQHPFWIVVLLAALQHGLFVGVATAGMAGLIMDWPARPSGVDITAYHLDLALLPLQWLVVALTLGLFRQVQIRAQLRLEAENAALREMNEALGAEVARMDEVVESLQLAAATRPSADMAANRATDALSPEEESPAARMPTRSTADV